MMMMTMTTATGFYDNDDDDRKGYWCEKWKQLVEFKSQPSLSPSLSYKCHRKGMNQFLFLSAMV